MNNDKYKIYGAGDAGTVELLRLLDEIAVPYVFVDIRIATSGESPITFLFSLRLQTVPQIFHANGTYLGQFDDMLVHLNTQAQAA